MYVHIFFWAAIRWSIIFHPSEQLRYNLTVFNTIFQFRFYFVFHRENGSIINSFHTAAPNSLKPSECTPTNWELSKDTKSMAWSTVIWEWGDLNVTKQNKTTLLRRCIGKQNLHDNHPQSLSIMNPNLSLCIKQVHHTKTNHDNMQTIRLLNGIVMELLKVA